MKSIIILIALIPLCSVCNAQPKHRNDIHSSIKVDPSLLTSFKAREYVVNGQTIRYREAINSTNSRKAPCLVIFLHGHSGSGDDNQSQMANQGINAILNYLKKSKTQAIMLVPQCPKEYTWSGMEGGNKNKGYNPYIKSLIDHYVTTMGIDVSKIYILGASMGSMGTWHMINNYPKFFTAAFCASGGANECNQANLLHTPVYSTIGTAEGDKKMKSFRETVESINKNGGEAKLDVLEGLNHSQACEKAFTAERLEWVFSH